MSARPEPADEGDVLVLDGLRVDAAAPAVRFADRGFLYGEGAFETLRTYAGLPFAVSEHLILLEAACFDFSDVPFPRESILSSIDVALAARGERESALRIVLTGGTARPGATSVAARLSVYVHATDLPAEPTELRTRGATLVTHAPVFGPGADELGLPFKSLSYFPQIALLRHAQRAGADEVLIVTETGDVREAATGNVVFVEGGALVTPRGFLRAGVTAGQLLAAAPSLGLAPVRRRVVLRDLYEAEGVFLVSTLREIVPIASIDGHSLARRYPFDGLLRALRTRGGISPSTIVKKE